MRLIFVRHGQTDANIRELQGEGVAECDPPLNAVGVTQSESVAEELKDEKIDAIFTSPLLRAKQTAEIINLFHNVPLIEIPALRERNTGTLTGDAYRDLFDFDKNVRQPEIEPIEEYSNRIYGAIDAIKSYGYENVIVVSHGGVHHAFRAYCKGLEWAGNIRVDRVGNCDYRVYEI